MNVTSKRWDVSRARSLISRSTEHRFVVGGYAAARQVASRAPREPSRRKLLVRTAASVSTPRKGSGDTQRDVDAENVQLPSNNPKTLADSGPDGENIVASETGDRHEVTSVAENPPLDAVVTREIVPTVSVSNSPIPVSKGLNASFGAVVVGVAAVTAAVFGAFAVGRSLARRTAGGNENAIVRGLGIVDTIQARMLRRRQQREAIIRLNEFMGLIQTQTKVDLSAKNLGEKGGAYVLDSLAFNTVCQSLDLSNNGLGLVAVTQLCEVLKANDTLKSLSLSTNSAGDEGAVLIAQYMAGDASVASLKLNSNNINNEGAIALAEMLKTNTTLTSLELNNNGIEYDGAVALAEALAENNSIKVLGLSGNYLGPMGVSVLAQALKVNTSVEEIYIQGNDGGDVGVKSLCDALFERPGPIKTLDIGNNTMTEEGAQSLAKLLKAKQLVELDVYNNDFGDAGMYEIAGSLKDNKSLTSLDLGGNNVGADGIKALASAIKNCNTLRVLELSYNPMGPEGAKAIAEVSKYDLQLETLKVGWCKIGSGDGAKAIGDLIMFNTTISSLDLRGNNLGDEGAISIARSMKEHDNQHFAELDMGYNEIKDAGACALAQSLKANVEGAVKELKLNQNYITRFGQVALTEALDLVYELGGGKETTIVF